MAPRRAVGVEPREELLEVGVDGEPEEGARVEEPRRDEDREHDEPHRHREHEREALLETARA